MNLAIMFLIAILPPVPGKLTAGMLDIMNRTSSDQQILVIVHMSTDYPSAAMANLEPAERGKIMRNIAINSQQDVVAYLSSLPSQQAVVGGQYWIFNGFHLKATPAVIMALIRRDDIWFISENGKVELPAEEVTESPPDVTEWNIQQVQADSCWQAGYAGDGIIIGFVDTGMMITHEALVGKWLSPYWLDAINGQPSPYDDHGHGTGVCGIICGGDGPGPLVNDIGVAYKAKVIPTKAFNSSGSATYVWIDSCLQYLADLRSGGVAIRAVNNSWGSNSTTELHWWSIMLNMKNLGILPAAAVGSSGPGSGTVGVPASYPTVIATGATDASDIIASFSSRGPAPDMYPWNDSSFWYYSTWHLLKPDVSAPGVNIRTSYNNGTYVNISGASFAIPHLSGGIALFCDRDSNLTVGDLYYLFRAYCDQPSGGGTYPNNNYGWGRINLWRALNAIGKVKEAHPLTNSGFSLEALPTVARGRVNIICHPGHDGQPGAGEIKIYDITGRPVRSFLLESKPGGHEIVWWGDDQSSRSVPAGIYLVELTAGRRQLTAKVLILR